MKTCSKCKRELDESMFVKSARYRDGMYPSCKDCRKKALELRLSKSEMCSKCGVKPHQPKHPYCYDCQRDAKGYTEPPKFRRDSSNKICSKCKVSPRAQGKNYCRECANRYFSEYWVKRGGQWRSMTPDQKHIATVRQYAQTLLKAGKVKRTPCVFCGDHGTEFHHYDYEPRTRNFESVCNCCHDDAHKFLDSMLEMMKMGARFEKLVDSTTIPS